MPAKPSSVEIEAAFAREALTTNWAKVALRVEHDRAMDEAQPPETAAPPPGALPPAAAFEGADGPARGCAPSLPRFACAADRDLACEQLARTGFVVVQIEGIGPSVAGRLGEMIDEAVERELRARGAAGPGVAELATTDAASERDAVLGNQVYRARSAGAAGIAIVLGPLRAAARRCRGLDPCDCDALRHLASATRALPLVLILDSDDARTGGYVRPVPLERILDAAPETHSTGISASSGPPPVLGSPTPTRRPLELDDPAFEASGAWQSPFPLADDRSQGATPLGTATSELLPREGRCPVPGSSPASSVAPMQADRDGGWQRWALTLEAARGPQPLGALEKLFKESYVPLASAIASGFDDPRAKCAYDDFRGAFVRSYTEAFATFAATTKRPRMALDVPEIAGRIARLHGARSTRLLLVDAMRWDLSRWTAERLSAKLGSRAVLTDELLLWSALPTKTTRQLETIARGVEALRAPADLEADAEPPRGRTSEFIRRMRVGPRELHKLDIVEARLCAARGAVVRALPDIADATAEVIARHADTLPPHTLLFVFGDHGFTIDRGGSAQQGGASPEEVLAGAFALLIGDVH